LIKKSNEATRLLGKLDGITHLLPDADFFLLMYLRKDAASSSQIEGTVATMVDAIEAEVKVSTSVPADVDDILHYLKAMHYGIDRISMDEFPVSLRLIRELHYQLIHKARVTHFSDPGEFRKTQNWIGGTTPQNARFVPPPVETMNAALGDLERFIHTESDIPILLKAGLLHAQFETIHPFLDGNGRTGRMLINIYLGSRNTSKSQYCSCPPTLKNTRISIMKGWKAITKEKCSIGWISSWTVSLRSQEKPFALPRG